MKKVRNVLDRLPIDNKLIVAIVTYLLTFAVARGGLDLNAVVIPPYTLSALIATAAAAAAGYLMPNEATTLREAEEQDGNPAIPPEHQDLIETPG